MSRLLPQVSELLNALRKNRVEQKALEKQGEAIMADLKKIQASCIHQKEQLGGTSRFQCVKCMKDL